MIKKNKKIAILQSNYIPWKGYFDLIAAVDEFVIFDDMQYTKRDWRNRNKIKTDQGLRWLTVPVEVKGKFHQKIKDTQICETDWAKKHWSTLVHHYSKVKHFDAVAAWLKPLYLNNHYTTISELNIVFMKKICEVLGIDIIFKNSWDYDLAPGKTEKLLNICLQAGADEYFSGPSAKGYLDEDLFRRNGIKVTWFNYDVYLEYPQLWGDFVHEVTVLDLLFNCGNEAGQYMKFIGKHS